ncbi:MAG: DUF5813 family protein [Halapricum sp.]
MTAEFSSTVRDAFASYDGYTVEDDRASVETTVFDGQVTITDVGVDWAHRYVVTVTVPSLSAAVAGTVGDAIRSGWLDTFERRLEDAPKATRASIELDAFEVAAEEETVTVTYEFTNGDPRQAADVAKTFVEYVEGTYAEGIVPGYDYEPPVSRLLEQAQSGGSQGERGGTPL